MVKFVPSQTHWCRDALLLIKRLFKDIEDNPNKPIPLSVVYTVNDLNIHLSFLKDKLITIGLTDDKISLVEIDGLVEMVEKELDLLDTKIKTSKYIEPVVVNKLSKKKEASAKFTVYSMILGFVIMMLAAIANALFPVGS